MSLHIGVHPVDAGGIDMAARRAKAAGAAALQIFTAIPRFYGDKSGIRPERVERFRAALEETGIQPRYVQAHAAYVLNVATNDAAKWTRAAAGLRKELERSTLLGIGGVCFHPGSAKDGTEAAAQRVARAMTQALQGVEGETRLWIENTAGAGSTYGRTAAEVAAVLERIPEAVRGRAGYGLDTCHLFASGYDIAASPAALSAVLDEFEEACGEPPSFLHLNDSEGALASNRDRHTLIGEGTIGAESFGWLLHDRRARRIPLILETPEERYDYADDDPSADPWDARMIALLEEMAP